METYKYNSIEPLRLRETREAIMIANWPKENRAIREQKRTAFAAPFASTSGTMPGKHYHRQADMVAMRMAGFSRRMSPFERHV